MAAKNKTLGFIFLALAIIFLDPIVGPTDAIAIPIYEMFSGVDVTLDNLSSTYFDYFIWHITVGFILLAIALYFLGWDLKMLFKKLDLGKYKIALMLGVLVVAIIAYLDIQGLIFFTDLGRDYTTGDFPQSYWFAFRNTAYILMGLVALSYYLFVRQDKSETLAVFLTPFILFWTGLADVLYFVFRRTNIPETLPWLDKNPIIGWISTTLGFEQVTNVSLLISVFIGFIVVILATKVLKERF